MIDDRGPVVVATAPDIVSGEIVACALQSAGIPAEVLVARTGRPYPAVHVGYGSAHVTVPRALEAEARAILAELDAGAAVG